MKSLGRLILPALAWLVALSALSAKSVVTDITPPKSGKVTADRVNVRARASLIGERVTQLRKEDTVTVLATVKIDPPKEGEPAEWLKIAMPAGGQTWVHMAFVKEGKVTANKLNVRAGGSERFSIVAHLAKDDEVKEKRT
ncbi:MAG: SH3 domain-containing protein, partial [Limisphaerales bacterium]